MEKRLRLCAAFMGMLLAACTPIPEYTRPAAPVPGQWPDGPAYNGKPPEAGDLAADDLHWREFFTDPRLREIIETALKNNRDLRVAALNVERVRALYRIQRDERLPTVDATGSGSKKRIPADLSSSGRAITAEEYRVELGFSSWEIDFFGRLRSLEQRALEEYLASEEARRGARILLISEVANAYTALAADRENLQLSRSTLESQQAAYNLIRRRFEVGLAPKLDLRQVQTRVDTARVDAARFTELTAQDENALNLLVGSPVPASHSPETLSAIMPPRGFSPGLSSALLLRRPDIRRAENLLKAANANIGAARAALFPRISLTSAIGTASDDLSGLFSAGTAVWNFAPKIALPIFDSRAWSALGVRKVEREIALAQYEGAIQSAFRDVADALARRGTLGERMAAQQSLVEATADTYRLSNARYEKGTDTYLSVLDAQRSLYAAQQGLITVRLTDLASQVRLYAVLAGGDDADTSMK